MLMTNWRISKCSYALHQFRQINSECVGDEMDVPEAQVSLASFDSSHVGPVQPAFGSESFLGSGIGLLPS